MYLNYYLLVNLTIWNNDEIMIFTDCNFLSYHFLIDEKLFLRQTVKKLLKHRLFKFKTIYKTMILFRLKILYFTLYFDQSGFLTVWRRTTFLN